MSPPQRHAAEVDALPSGLASIKEQAQTRRRLCAAVERGDVEAVKRCLSCGMADTSDEHGTPLLLLAAATGSTKVTRLLLQKGASVDRCEPSTGGTALHYAAIQGFTGCVQLLLQFKATVDVLAMDGATPLISACCHDREACVRTLIAAGADQTVTVDGKTALHWAQEKGHSRIVALLRTVATVAEDDPVQPVMHEALCDAVNQNDLQAVRRILLSDATTSTIADAVNAAGLPALLCAAMHGHVQMAELLIERGAVVDAQHRPSGATALITACAHGHGPIVQLLLERGALATALDRSGSSALHAAASQGHELCVEILLSHSVPADAASASEGATGTTPLHLAAAKGHAGCVRMLLRHGASLHSEVGGKTALMLAQQSAMHASLNGVSDADVARHVKVSELLQAEATRRADATAEALLYADARKEATLSIASNKEVGLAASAKPPRSKPRRKKRRSAGPCPHASEETTTEAAPAAELPPGSELGSATEAMAAMAEAAETTAKAPQSAVVLDEEATDGTLRPAPAEAQETVVPAPPAVEPPEIFVCPITQELMLDPVFALDGHTYERAAIEEWLARRLMSPKTGVALDNPTVIPNHAMRQQIIEWREAHVTS